jgi:hypothetical protein
MSKSLRTRQRHQKSWKNQATLDTFFNSQPATPSTSSNPAPLIPKIRRVSDRSDLSSISSSGVEIIEPNDGEASDQASIPATTPTPSLTPEPNLQRDDLEIDDEWEPDDDNPDDQAHDQSGEPNQSEEVQEEWEHELDLGVQGTSTEVRDWGVLRKQIQDDLKKRYRTFSLSQINQLMILSNFATLRLKGTSRIAASMEIARQWHPGDGVWFARRVRALARHYQTFEQLPVEHRGGYKNARTLLRDENVKKASLDYLTSLPTGEVTPKKFQIALNTTILANLGITTQHPLCIRTARRWLIKLGWRHTLIKKGVYMDGHERADVVKYRQEVFLPLMAKYEARMVHFEGPDLERVEPNLQPGEREIIANFHDESTFHGNEQKSSAWLRPGEQPLRKKGRGRLIHASAFINPITGRLILVDADGNVLRDSMKVIYPGSNGDPWWDTQQLLKQMVDAIDIFEAAHPNKQSLFIFDQSSAHASLPPNALRAFEMNKSDGGKQRVQRDTIIPDSNPTEALRGRVQTMTLPDGRPKGLQRVLEERGFKVSHLRTKCAPVCPIENQDCCMARLLSQQDDFKNQESMLETYIRSRGHECIFLPKFHCELNPIEMVRTLISRQSFTNLHFFHQVLGLVQVPLS